MTRLVCLTLCLVCLLSGCGKFNAPAVGDTIALADFNENRVSVEIMLELDENGLAWLSATFLPEEGYHLYGKDLPRDGMDGLGRPTLLELVPGSRIKPAGELSESVAVIAEEDPDALPVYPAGEVTLRLPVTLPEGAGWYDEQVSVTYMACHTGKCCPPVVGKLVAIRVPGADEVQNP
jgi:hypothetical protein